MRRCGNLDGEFAVRPLLPNRVFAGFGRRFSGSRWSIGDRYAGRRAVPPGNRMTAKPVGGGLPKGRPSRSKKKPQGGKAQERHESGSGLILRCRTTGRLAGQNREVAGSAVRTCFHEPADGPLNHRVGSVLQECSSTAGLKNL